MVNPKTSLSPADSSSPPLAVLLTAFGWLLAPVCAQAVDYPSSTLASPPALTFPFYTPGAGSSGQTVRAQFLCPDSWLQTQGLSAGLVTRIGISLAGQAIYDTLVLRAGPTTVSALGSDWTVNLPDQRVQRDLSNTTLQGGGTPSAMVNQWVEYDLDFPFYWQPGQGIVVDIVSHILVPGSYVGTTSGAPVVPRAYNFNYLPGSPATNFTGFGAAFRMVFANTDLVPFGAGCTVAGGTIPTLASTGAANLGGTMVLFANQTLEPSIGGFLFGYSRTTWSGGALPFDLGGGCPLLVSPDVLAIAPITPAGGGLGSAAFALVVPSSPQLLSSVIYTQWTQLDAGSTAIVPATFSHGGKIVIVP